MCGWPYTGAMYKPETFEVLAYTETCRKLVEVYGYPQEVLDYTFDPEYMVGPRGRCTRDITPRSCVSLTACGAAAHTM